MKRTLTIRAGLLAAMMALLPNAAAAQWNVTGIGVAEYDTEQTLLLLAGLSASPGGIGIAPLIGVQASHLSWDGGVDRTNVFTVRPYAGLRSSYTGGSLYGTVGYAFSNREEDTGLPVAADRGSGVVVSGGLDHWGTGGPLGYQLLGSYNFGSESYWTRGRVTTRIGSSMTRFGGEVALLGGDGYSAWQPGVVLEFHHAGGRIFGIGAGAKVIEDADNAFYVRLDAVLPLARR